MKALMICGSLNQTRMMYQVARHLEGFDIFFSQYYADGHVRILQKLGFTEATVLGGRFFQQASEFLERHSAKIDYRGVQGPYDLVVTCSDLVVPRNVRGSKVVLVQEGMTDPEDIFFLLYKWLHLPRWFGSTATTGLSDAYQIFCVASEGFKALFARRGVRPEKIRVTGIPNFDDCIRYADNDFPLHDYLLVATSDRRECYRYENRRRFIRRARELADGRQIVFKFHPNENVGRARHEVERYCPEAITFAEGNAEHMVANCSALLTRFSSVVFPALALGKKVYASVPVETLRELLPIQNGGTSARRIAEQCMNLF